MKQSNDRRIFEMGVTIHGEGSLHVETAPARIGSTHTLSMHYRFSPEERARHSPFDHMPFGYGPRNCIAMRMALMEVKLAAAMILKNFNLLMSPKTIVSCRIMRMLAVAFLNIIDRWNKQKTKTQ